MNRAPSADEPTPPRRNGDPRPGRGLGATREVLVCFAVREEARFFAAPEKPITRILLTGMGIRHASTAIQRQLTRRRPELVLSCGFAGGLNPAHRLGAVLTDDTYGGRFRNRFPIPSDQRGRFVHSDHVVITPKEKADLFTATGADAVEMESSAIVAACRAQAVPVIVMRAVSDTAHEALPVDFNRFSRPDGTMSLPRLVFGLARAPSTLPELLRFRERLKVAARALAASIHTGLTAGHLF